MGVEGVDEFYRVSLYFSFILFFSIFTYFSIIFGKTLRYYPIRDFPEYNNLVFTEGSDKKRELANIITNKIIPGLFEIILVCGEGRYLKNEMHFTSLKKRIIEANKENKEITVKIILGDIGCLEQIKQLKKEGANFEVYKSMIYPKIHFAVYNKRHVYIQEIHKPNEEKGEYFISNNKELAMKLISRFSKFTKEKFCDEVTI